MKRNVFLLVCYSFFGTLLAQSPMERAIPIHSQFLTSDSLELTWPSSSLSNPIYSVFKSNPLLDELPELLVQQSDTMYRDELANGDLAEYTIYASDPFPFRDTLVVDSSYYEIKVEDQFGKGLCCNFGMGYFKLTNGMNEEIFRVGDFGMDTTWVFHSSAMDTLYLEIQSDLFGDHLQYAIRDTILDSLLVEFGPFGLYRQGPPTHGTLWIGNNYRLPDSLGSVLILSADNLTDSLEVEIAELKTDLEKMGYRVLQKSVSMNSPDRQVRDSIDAWFDDYPGSKTLYILGHVAVPYSGDIFPDTHSENHRGAWSADGFYGVDSTLWTDTLVNESSALFDRNKNVPGDGKWDQSTFPGMVNYKIGRVDLTDLESFEKNEIELTKAYLNKAKAWRRGEIIANEIGLVDDNFDDQFGAPAANGYRNLWNLLGKERVFDLDFSTELNTASYLWAYSCGSGTHHSAAGVTSTEEIAEDSLQAIFLMSFGSQFGDWDNDDNFLRAPLASGTVLTNMWVGNPHIDYREMGLGFPIGHSIQRNMNRPSPLHEKGPVLVHLGLMGDPTLTQFPIAAAQELKVSFIPPFGLELNWTASPSPYVNSYEIYRSDSLGTDWTLINSSPVVDTFFTDLSPFVGINQYQVFTIGYIENNGGRFYKRSMPISGQDTFKIIDHVQQVNVNEQWSIYPNPAHSQLTLEHPALEDDESDNGVLVNVLGNLFPIKEKSSKGIVKIDVREMAPGIYYYRKDGLISPAIILGIIKN